LQELQFSIKLKRLEVACCVPNHKKTTDTN
jgi:hypothetical protein